MVRSPYFPVTGLNVWMNEFVALNPNAVVGELTVSKNGSGSSLCEN
jgi:hypothetical protein